MKVLLFVALSSASLLCSASTARADVSCVSVPSGDVLCMGNNALGQGLISNTLVMPWGDKVTRGSLESSYSYTSECLSDGCN